ncbi:MAG: hypothetical protein Q8P35_01075, partial [Candidatus Yanofskybacteria bacterium]|nr:hypothetical protein [Candidatus Yanofskybacteria bacterium]
ASALIFETSDGLSGISHYQVAVIDESTPDDISPVFFESKSPYHFPESLQKLGQTVTVVVRAFDHAGNIRDAQIRVPLRTSWTYMLRSSLFWIGFSVLLALVGLVHFIRKHAYRVAQRRTATAFATRSDEPPREV